MNKDTKEKPIKDSVRPTKKQKALLDFIATFIAEHGYSPSYREIMKSLNYTSVSTVALHVSNLIKRGHLVKRDYSARSLEVVNQKDHDITVSGPVSAAEEKWLVKNIDNRFKQVEDSAKVDQSEVDDLYVLVGALKVLGLEGAAHSFIARLSKLKATN